VSGLIRLTGALAAVLLVALPLGPARASDAIVGDWVLNRELSSNPGTTALLRYHVTLLGKNVQVQGSTVFRDNVDQTFEYVYKTDGSTHTVVGPKSLVREVQARWDGDALVVTWTTPSPYGDIQAMEVWTASDKGLDVSRVFQTAQGATNQRLFFVRRPPDEASK
jgi:hypothetical protein